jgi:transcriptional regulator GlxA family with amidase domain
MEGNAPSFPTLNATLNMKAAILLYPGAEELDAFAPFEVLQAARALGADWETHLVTVGEPQPVTLAHGAVVMPHTRFTEAEILIVPGGGAEAQNPATLGLLRDVHREGTLVAGVCTGTMILAHAGLLDGRPAITHHSALDDLAATGAVVTPARVVDAGDIVTCGGVTSGLDLALWLVERHGGAPLAMQVEGYLEYERRGIVWRV